jgi:serine/threonine protein phosphatase 1
MRRIIIGDVHGFYSALCQLFNLLQIQSGDQVYFVGDLIDRGPQSKQVLDFVREQRYPCVMGNHERLLLDALTLPAHSDAMENWTHSGGEATLKSFANRCSKAIALIRTYQSWLESLPLFIEQEDLFIVHAGVNPRRAIHQQDPNDFYWIRKPFHTAPNRYFPDKTIITGHTPTVGFGLSAGQIAAGPQWFDIDTGVHMTQSGWLSALSWETQQVFQVNAQTQAERIMPLKTLAVSITSKSA